eukprot:9204716-Pyramimonas_sp.AAC.1
MSSATHFAAGLPCVPHGQTEKLYGRINDGNYDVALKFIAELQALEDDGGGGARKRCKLPIMDVGVEGGDPSPAAAEAAVRASAPEALGGGLGGLARRAQKAAAAAARRRRRRRVS